MACEHGDQLATIWLKLNQTVDDFQPEPDRIDPPAQARPDSTASSGASHADCVAVGEGLG